jgi:hypothetical protein
MGLLTLEPTSKPPESMPGEGTTRETTINSGNITCDKNNYSNKDGTILTLTRHTRSP